MRLILLADAAAPHTRRWAKWFALKGHEVHVLSFNPDSLPNYEPAVVHSLWSYKGKNSIFVRLIKILIILVRIKKIFREYPPDLVHSHSAGGYAWAGAIIGFKPYVITPWGTDLLVDIVKSKLNYWLTSKSLAAADLVTTDGFHFVSILESLGVNKNKIYVRPFGTNLNHFVPGQNCLDKKLMNIPDNAPVIISTRTLNPVHDVETFIYAIPIINKDFPDARFLIVGDGIERKKFEILVDKLKVRSVTIFAGMVEEDKMLRLLQISNIYVSTSKLDAGLAASTAEAMAVGLPVIQTNNSDNQYWTPNGEGGILIPNSDSQALSDAIQHLLKNKELCINMGKRNREKVFKDYNMDTEMSLIEDEYKSLLNQDGY